MKDNKYYVYRYIIKETNEVFYIGKGSGWRYARTDKRNKFFVDMYKTHECEVQILQRGMSEEDAFNLEKLLISYYRKFTNFRLTNICDGGEGVSGHRWTDKEKEVIRLRSLGENNPNYGNKWTEEQKEKLRKKQISSKRYVGSKNPNSKRIQCVETGEIFETIQDAQRKYNVKTQSSFTWALKNPHRTAAGLHWKYLS